MQPIYQPNQNLDLLRTLYIVKACFNFLGVLFFVIYALFGSFMFGFIDEVPQGEHNTPFPSSLTWVFIVIGAVGVVVCLVFAIITLIAAKRIKNRKGYSFIFVAGIINCFTGILGIGLGVFTFVELNKPHVKALFHPKGEQKIGF